MARCAQCGEETAFAKGCASCTPLPSEPPPSLETAREEYRYALSAQREALAQKHSLDEGKCDESVALHNANRQLEIAAARYDEALRQFVRAQARLRRSS